MIFFSQLAVKDAREREKNRLLQQFVCFRCLIKDFWTEVFQHLSEKLLLSQKIRYFVGSRFSQCLILSPEQLSIARYQVSFYASLFLVITHSVQCQPAVRCIPLLLLLQRRAVYGKVVTWREHLSFGHVVAGRHFHSKWSKTKHVRSLVWYPMRINHR